MYMLVLNVHFGYLLNVACIVLFTICYVVCVHLDNAVITLCHCLIKRFDCKMTIEKEEGNKEGGGREARKERRRGGEDRGGTQTSSKRDKEEQWKQREREREEGGTE